MPDTHVRGKGFVVCSPEGGRRRAFGPGVISHSFTLTFAVATLDRTTSCAFSWVRRTPPGVFPSAARTTINRVLGYHLEHAEIIVCVAGSRIPFSLCWWRFEACGRPHITLVHKRTSRHGRERDMPDQGLRGRVLCTPRPDTCTSPPPRTQGWGLTRVVTRYAYSQAAASSGQFSSAHA